MNRPPSSAPAQAVGEIVQVGEPSLDATDKKLEAPEPRYVWVKYAADDLPAREGIECVADDGQGRPVGVGQAQASAAARSTIVPANDPFSFDFDAEGEVPDAVDLWRRRAANPLPPERSSTSSVDVDALADAVAARLRDVAKPPHPRDGLLNAREAAALLGISHSTFRDVVRPDLPTVRISRRVAFDRRELERWAIEHTEDGSSDSRGGVAVRRTSSGSAMLDAATKNPRVEQIRAKLLSKPRRSTRT
jgi:predicted DNA-binding transcriptional regulator AlpA